MWKGILAGSVALAIAGSSLVYGQERPRNEGRRGPNVEDARAFGDARIAALKAGLSLTPEQEKLWPAYEQAARDLAKVVVEQRNLRRSSPRATDPAERLRQRGTRMAETGAALQKLADATDPLYKSLDDAQKRRFTRLSRVVERVRGRGRDRD